jgi:hypothetical protein
LSQGDAPAGGRFSFGGLRLEHVSLPNGRAT